jgi:hypothetical protein
MTEKDHTMNRLPARCLSLCCAGMYLLGALIFLSGCTSTKLGLSSDNYTPFSSMYYEPVKGRVNQQLLSELKFSKTDLPYEGCDFSPASISIAGTVPPGITTTPGNRIASDKLGIYFEGKPTQTGDFAVQVTFQKISCKWKYDTKNYGDRTVNIKFHIDK